jgi:hypothetical protein
MTELGLGGVKKSCQTAAYLYKRIAEKGVRPPHLFSLPLYIIFSISYLSISVRMFVLMGEY